MTMAAEREDDELCTARENLRLKVTACLDAELKFRRMSSQRITSLLSGHLGPMRSDNQAEARLRRMFRQVLVQERKKLKEIQKSLSSSCSTTAKSLTESISLEIKSQSDRLALAIQENNELKATVSVMREEIQNHKEAAEKLKNEIENSKKEEESEAKLRSQLNDCLDTLKTKDECIRQLTEAKSANEHESEILREETRKLANNLREMEENLQDQIQKLIKSHQEEINKVKTNAEQSDSPTSAINEQKEEEYKRQIDHFKAKLFDYEKAVQEARTSSKNMEVKYGALERKLLATQKKLKTAEKVKAKKSSTVLSERPIFSPAPQAETRQNNDRVSEGPAESNFSVTPFVKAQRSKTPATAISPTRPSELESRSQSGKIFQRLPGSNPPLAIADVNLPPRSQTLTSEKQQNKKNESDSSKLTTTSSRASTEVKFSFFSDEENRDTEEEPSFLLSRKADKDKRTSRKRKLATNTNKANSILIFGDDEGDEPSPRLAGGSNGQIPKWPQGMNKEISPVKKRNKSIADMFRL